MADGVVKPKLATSALVALCIGLPVSQGAAGSLPGDAKLAIVSEQHLGHLNSSVIMELFRARMPDISLM